MVTVSDVELSITNCTADVDYNTELLEEQLSWFLTEQAG